MTTRPQPCPAPRLRVAALSLLSLISALWPARAQNALLGTIEGRVLNATSGEYVELARLSIAGTSLEAFTDSNGRYRLMNVPAGTVTLKLFHTGATEQAKPVTVAAGRTTGADFTLVSREGGKPGRDTVVLGNFVVSSAKEMGNAALAINTQRFAPNQMNVISADEFGGAAESKVGEVLKSLPGISMTAGGGGEPYQVSMDGVPANNVPVTLGGVDLPSSGTGTVRAVGLHQIAINTISRVEVMYTPTPESSGASLAGSVNLVPLSAFERSRPSYDLRATLSMRDDARSLHRTPGPGRDPTHKIRPGFEFTGIVPVNRRFGFTLNASAFTLWRGQSMSQSGWRGTALATNGGTLPDTTPDRPYLTDYTVRDAGAMVTGASLGGTVDLQLGPNDQVSLAFQWSFSDYALTQRLQLFLVNRVTPGNFGSTWTRGFTGAGEIRKNIINNGLGGNLYLPTLTYRHNGPIWQSELGFAHAQSGRWRKDATRGSFYNAVARRQNVTVSYEDIFYLRPNRITVADGATGAPVDPYQLDGYLMNTASTNGFLTTDLRQTAYANLRRALSGPVPLVLKGGLDLRRQRRDTRNSNPTLTFVGRDGLANTADDSALVARDAGYSGKAAPYGFPGMDWMSTQNLWDTYRSSPGHFTENKVTSYTQEVALSKYAEEVVSAAYLRGDMRFLQGRLKVVGGIRTEQTNVRTQGRLIDPTRNFQRDAAGKVILGANRAPLPVTSDALEAARLTNLDRGLHTAKEYLRWFPSLNLGHEVTGNLVARAGYYWSVGRPDFNQYGGSANLPNTENPPGPSNQISLNNAGIKAWTARTMKVGLEYYFEPAGLFSVTAFRRDFRNLFGQTVLRATPEFLALYGLNPATYGDYDVSTQYNLRTTVTSTGLSGNYKQALTFLPGWAQGVRVFANASAQRITGDDSGAFAGYTPRTANWGLSLSRPTYTAKVNWNYTGRRRNGAVAAGRSIDPGTYNWSAKRLIVDVNAEYRLTRNLAAFASLSNLQDDPIDDKIYGPTTPDYARFRQRQEYGSLWTFGLRSNF